MLRKIDYAHYVKPTDFARFEQGDTTIRIISNGALVKKHGLKTANGYVPLGDCTEKPDCEQCLKGNEPKQKWIWICAIRPTNDVKLLDVGAMTGDAICKIAQKREQDPKEYDLIINKVGVGLRTKYIVKVGEVKPLGDEELKAMEAMKTFLVNKYFKN